MTKHNRWLVIIFLFAMLTIIAMFVRDRFLRDNSNPLGNQENYGEAIPRGVPQKSEEQTPQGLSAIGNVSSQKEKRIFSIFLKQFSDCAKLNLVVPDLSNPSIESIIQSLPRDFGQPVYKDRWLNWHLHNQEGLERRIRLVIDPSGEGSTGRELQYYAVDSDGLPVPLLLKGIQTHNPSAEVLNALLKEGGGFYKEKASSVVFPNGKQLNYLEKNEELIEIEFSFGQGIFKCENVKSPLETCHCLN